MKNLKKGTLLCVIASILSIATIFLWAGKSYVVYYTVSGQEMTEIHNVFSMILGNSILDASTLFFMGGIILSIISLNRAISGYLNNKNNTLLCSSLLSVNVISAYLLYLNRDLVAAKMNIPVSIAIDINLIILQAILVSSFILSIVGTIIAYKNQNKEN
jgi:hypothetical protein